MTRRNADDTVCVGRIVGAHGVRGLVKIKPYTAEPEGLTAYGPVMDADGRRVFRLDLKSMANGQWLAAIDSVTDRTAAQALRGTDLYVRRDALPAPGDEDEFYHADLIGLTARDAAGAEIGHVTQLFDFGAGDLIEVAVTATGERLTLPFTRAVVPTIDLAAGFIVVVPPPETEVSDGATETGQ